MKPDSKEAFDFDGAGPVFHFAHANGYPPGVYKALINPITSDFKVLGIIQRPFWDKKGHNKLKHWSQLADDLIHFLEKRNLSNIIGGGHSLGAIITIIAAHKRPDLFSKLVLIDPVLFPDIMKWPLKLLPPRLSKHIIPISRTALKRRDVWTSQEEMYESYRSKRVFSKISDEVLMEFVEQATEENGNNQITLRFTKLWEAQVYATVFPAISTLFKLDLPILAIRGEKSDVVSDKIWGKWQKEQPHNKFLSVKDTGHLVPLEAPDIVSEWILKNI